MRNGLSSDLIARILGVAPKYTIAELEQKFPPRNLPDGAMVTRAAPSPTGFMHLGNLYSMLIDKKLAQQSHGVFMLRIEDTDTDREIPGAVDTILDIVEKFRLDIDEGVLKTGLEKGAYGPYTQSQRKEIYHSVAAELLATGRAYPCFLTSDEMNEIRETQTKAGMPTGIYGEFARDRDMMPDEIIAKIDAGVVPSVRLYSTGDPSKKIFCKDVARGSIAFPENNDDVVLIKSNDGLPTYHFAHLVDDHFMRTTNVVRGGEWLASLPLHIQMFNMMGWAAPAYSHTATIDKIDDETGKQRKLSKRKDPESSVANFITEGWPIEAVLEYLFNLVASGYEEEKVKNPLMTIWDYDLKLKKLSTSGALFDWKKLEWWGKEFIATLPVYDLVNRVMEWVHEYSPQWHERIGDKIDYLTKILAIERDNPKRVRKDFVTWKQTLEEVAYFFDDIFEKSEIGNQKSEINKNALDAFLRGFEWTDDKDTWWNKIVKIASDIGTKNGDVAMSLRVALTGRTNTPDLYSIMQVMGGERVIKRIGKIING